MKCKKIINCASYTGLLVLSNMFINNTNVLASNNGGLNSSSVTDEYGNYIYGEQIENALHTAGITNTNVGYDIFNIVGPNGSTLTPEQMGSLDATGGAVTVKLEYKDNELGKQMADLFGNDTYAIQHYMNQSGITSTNQLESKIGELSNLKNQINSVQSQIKFSNGSSLESMMTIGPDGLISLVGGGKFSATDASGNTELLSQLSQLLDEWNRLTGSNMMNTLSPDQISIVIGQLGAVENSSVVITPATRQFYALNRVVISIKTTDGKPVNATPNNSKTQQLFNQYSSTMAKKFRTITGQTTPNIVSLGNGNYEINFMNEIKKKNNYVNDVLANWTYGSKDLGSFMPTAAFTLGKSSENIVVELQVYADIMRYKEKIAFGVYPTGKASGEKDDVVDYNENNYKWTEYKNSYFTSKNPVGVDQKTKKIKYDTKYTKEKNIEYKVKTNTKWEKKYNYTTMKYESVKKEYYTLDSSNKVKWKNASSVRGSNSNRPLISTNDGDYVRNIWFKKQQIRYWDYCEKPLSEGKAYSEKYIQTKYKATRNVGVADTYLVNFDNDRQRTYGYIKTEQLQNKRLPDGNKVPGEKFLENKLIRTYKWTLAPLSGEIEIPVKTQVGSVNGVISDADLQID